MNERGLLWGTILVLSMLMFAAAAYGDVVGADVAAVSSSRGTDETSTTANSQAGNVTQLSFNQTRITDIWQGYYGNISGTLTLDDASTNTFYDWTLTTMTGEVYASRTSITDWSTVNCANTAIIDSEQTGLGITNSWTDSINKTFDTLSHAAFSVGTQGPFTTCPSTQAYNSTGGGEFLNAMLNVSDVVVYTTVINDNANGFNSNTWDFELLVPTNYTAGGTASYYFYAELE